MKYKKSFRDIILVLVAFFILIGLIFSSWNYFKCINNERSCVLNKAELIELSYKLARSSEELTNEVRKFSITLNPAHLRNYWTEVNVNKTREKIISRLVSLNVPQDEVEAINSAKVESDELINSEIKSMKLILLVYEVPEAQMGKEIRDFVLSQELINLSFNDKINYAREILYNNTYSNSKEKIRTKIKEFRTLMEKRVDASFEEAKLNTNRYIYVFFSFAFMAVFYLFYLVWFFIIRISIPLKKHLIEFNDDESSDNIDVQNLDIIMVIEELKKKNKEV